MHAVMHPGECQLDRLLGELSPASPAMSARLLVVNPIVGADTYVASARTILSYTVRQLVFVPTV